MDAYQSAQPAAKRPNSPIPWAVLAIVLLVAIGVAIYAYWNNNQDGNANSNAIAALNSNGNTNAVLNENGNMNGTVNANAAGNQNANSGAINANRANNSNTSVDTSSWKTYTNDQYAFSIKYPEICTSSESTESGGLLLTSWGGCGMDVFVDQANGKTVDEWARDRNYHIVDTYSTNQQTFTIATFTGEEAGTRSLALISHGRYMFRIDLNQNDTEKLKAILSTMRFI